MIDMELTINGYTLNIVVDDYSITPPSGKCAARCETPEEFYGDTDISYRIVAIQGEDLNRPEDVNEWLLNNEIIEKINESME